MQKKNRSRKTHDATNKTANLAVKTNGPKTARRREGYIRSIVPKTLSRTRSDIATWRSALRAADNVDNPRRARLMNLYDDVMLCAHLTSQIELRQKIYRRHGIVGWIGGGQVWGTDRFRWGNTLCSFGCGYRFEFKNKMNIRLDYGWGNFGNRNLPWDRKRSSAFLFTASEAF